MLCGDGDLMEGISHESSSLAGTSSLGKLIVLYDDNLISLDGPTELSFTEDVTKSLRGLPLARPAWSRTATTSTAIEARDPQARQGRDHASRHSSAFAPSSATAVPKAGTSKVHGEALGAEAT